MRKQANTITIRTARAGDERFFAELSREAFARWSPAPARSVLSMLSARGSRGLVAEQGGGALGFAVVDVEPLGRAFGPWAHPKVARLDAIAVEPKTRRAGVGRALLHAAIAFAKEQGAVVMTLRTASGNKRAQRLFVELGFLPVLRAEEGYANGEDAIEMFAALDAAS